MALILSCNHTLCYWYICFLSHKVRENYIKYHSFKNLTFIIFVRFLPFNGQFFVRELLNCDHHFLLNSLFKLEIQFISILWHRAKRIETSFSRYRTWTVKYTKEFTFSKFSINSKFIRFKKKSKKETTKLHLLKKLGLTEVFNRLLTIFSVCTSTLSIPKRNDVVKRN